MNGRNVSTPGERILSLALPLAGLTVALGLYYGMVVRDLSPLWIAPVLGVAICSVLFMSRPDFIVPALIVTIPLEISKLFFPFLLLERTIDGNPVSIVELWRIGLVIGALAYVYLLLSARRNRKAVLVMRHPVVLSSMAFLVYCAIQAALISPEGPKAWFESARLGAHVFLLIMTVGLLSSMRRFELALKSFVYSSLALALAGIYQYLSGEFFWNVWLKDLAGMDRINVTFADPNIYARYLAVFVIISWVLINTKLIGKHILQVCLVAGSAALLFTFSRSGWLLIPAGLAVVWWYSRGGARARIIGGGLAIGTLAVVLFFSVGALQERAGSLAAGPASVLGQRVQLIDTGYQMFKEHPAFGIGLGSFGKVASEDYREFLPYGGEAANLSHTALVTVTAELGIVGLALTLWIFGATYKSFKATLTAGKEPHKTYALTCFVAIPIIVLSAQSEGRMFEEPILWVFLGMLIALERLTLRESMSSSRRS